VIEQEMTMLKTISAALFAVSVLVAPAMAAGPFHIANKTHAISAHHVGGKVLNAQARMHKHRIVRHHHQIRKHHTHKPVIVHRGHRH
jgi:hypothetical protein